MYLIGTTFVNDGPVLTGTLFDFQTLSMQQRDPDEDTPTILSLKPSFTGLTDEEGNDLFVNGLQHPMVFFKLDSVNGPWLFTLFKILLELLICFML